MSLPCNYSTLFISFRFAADEVAGSSQAVIGSRMRIYRFSRHPWSPLAGLTAQTYTGTSLQPARPNTSRAPCSATASCLTGISHPLPAHRRSAVSQCPHFGGLQGFQLSEARELDTCSSRCRKLQSLTLLDTSNSSMLRLIGYDSCSQTSTCRH